MTKIRDLRHVCDLAFTEASEDEKVAAMIYQSTKDYLPVNWQGFCTICWKSGHVTERCWKNKGESREMMSSGRITNKAASGKRSKNNNNNCHEKKRKIRRASGIPKSFMTTTTDPTAPGVLQDGSGDYVVPTIAMLAYTKGKKELPPFLPLSNPSPSSQEKRNIVETRRTITTCPICKDSMRDAVIIPCCGWSFCDPCVREALVDSDDHTCPQCHVKNQSPENLIPNVNLRKILGT